MKDFTIQEVKPKIFHLNFKDRYKLAMHFVRYQEFYESPNPKFRNKAFKLLDFMEWYANEFGVGSFTYPQDWIGFNVPSKIFKSAIETSPEENKYDTAMIHTYFECEKKVGDNFYIIGSVGEGKNGPMNTMKHEISHGFFYLNPEYKKQMTKLVDDLKPSFRNAMYKNFGKYGYTKQVYVDECQAYLSTGIPGGFKIKLKGEDKPFMKLFNEFYK